MFGTEPTLNAWTYCFARLTRTRPVMGLPWTLFVCIFPMTLFFKISSCFKKLGFNWSFSKSYKFCSYVSSPMGLSNVMQSRSVKRLLKSLRVRFFISVFSDIPLYSWREISKYSFAVISSPCWFTRARLKSLTSQRKDGNIFASSSGFWNSSTALDDFNWICFVKLTTRLSYYKLCSSMAFMLL